MPGMLKRSVVNDALVILVVVAQSIISLKQTGNKYRSGREGEAEARST